MSSADITEQQLKLELMVKANTSYKEGLLRYEPWKVLAAGMAAGAGILGAAIGLLGVLVHLFGK